MARIQTRKRKKRIPFTATVRVKDFPPLARTFDTKGEAKTWAAEIEKEMQYVPLTEMAENVFRSIRPVDAGNDMHVFLPQNCMQSTQFPYIPCHYFKRAFGTARAKTGLEDVHLHDLRHTAASHLLMAGVDIRTLAEIRGHKTLQMVHHYTHLLNDHKLKAVERINSLGLE
jgi:site-specific recombinase XerD